MHQDRISESSNMLHYSKASSIEKNKRYLVIKGGACLVALARERGRQLRSRTGQQQRRSRSLPELTTPLYCQSNQASPPPLITRYRLFYSILLALE